MRFASQTAALLGLHLCILALSGCGNADRPVSQVANTGPFDSRGNYIEEWADTPHKWNHGSRKPAQPSPIPDLPVIAKVDQPPPQSIPLLASSPAPARPPAPRPVTQTAAAPKPKLQVVSAPKPEPKPQAAKPTPPPTFRHTVERGDTLSGIASRYGSSVRAIQKANKLRDILISVGQKLTVPK